MLSGIGMGRSGRIREGAMPSSPYFSPRSSFVMMPRRARSPLYPEQALPGLVVTDRLTSLLTDHPARYLAVWLAIALSGWLSGCPTPSLPHLLQVPHMMCRHSRCGPPP